MAEPVSVGPFGGKGGQFWDDGVHSTVRRVVIRYDLTYIRSVHFEYDDSGKAVWSNKHGLDVPVLMTNTDTVDLDYPHEFFTSVHGNYLTNMPAPTHICSLTFKSNYKKTYGPFGSFSSEGGWGKCFSIQMTGYKIVGFHGTCTQWWAGSNLRALGAYLLPIDHHSGTEIHQHKSLLSHSLTPSKSTMLLPGNHTDATKLETTRTDDRPNQTLFIVCGNEVSRNKGDHNGTFSIGNQHQQQA